MHAFHLAVLLTKQFPDVNVLHVAHIYYTQVPSMDMEHQVFQSQSDEQLLGL